MDRPDTRRARRRIGLTLVVLGLLASLLALTPAAPSQAVTTRPILIVGGFGQTEELTEPYWADPLGAHPRLQLPDDKVRVIELSGVLPGTDSMEESADEIRVAIDALHAQYGPIDIIAVSQGSPAARRTLVKYPSTQAKVAGFISLSGANIGIPVNPPDPWWSGMLEACSTPPFVWEVCEQIVYRSAPGQTPWLRAVNGIQPAGDPTPGANIKYYYVYSERTTSSPPEDEGFLAYGWTTPLPGAEPKSAQDACPTNPNRFAPHAAWYSVDRPDDQDNYADADPVMSELVIDALNRDPLVIEDQTKCADHPGYPSG
jgi:pimeloyl-ACP methyl ester carboxylesterase